MNRDELDAIGSDAQDEQEDEYWAKRVAEAERSGTIPWAQALRHLERHEECGLEPDAT